MRLGWMFKAESVVIPAFIDVYTSSGDHPRVAAAYSTNRAESAPVSGRATCRANAEKNKRFFILHRVRFRDTVVCVVWDIKPNTLVRECHRSCFSGTLYPALARGRLQSSGERNITRKTHQSRKTGQATRLFQYHRLYTCDRSRFFTSYRVGFLEDTPRYAMLFGATAVFFGVAAAVSFWFRELPSQPEGTAPFFKFLGDALLSLRYDRNFRRFAIVILLFYSIWPLFSTLYGFRKADVRARSFWFHHVDNCTECIQCYRCRYHGQRRRSFREPIRLAYPDINQCLYTTVGGWH